MAFLVQCPHRLKGASTSARANAQVIALPPGHKEKTLSPHCLRVHNVQKFLLSASTVWVYPPPMIIHITQVVFVFEQNDDF